MQRVAAYLLERLDDMQWPEARAAEAKRLKAEVEGWLHSKGASSIGPTGTYQPEDGSAGTFKIHEAADSDRTWWMVDLQEDTAEGRRFSVGVSVTAGTDRVSVYVTLETGWTTTQVMPVSVDPRCPRIVRHLIQLQGRWFHGASLLLSQPKSVTGFDEGDTLAREIDSAHRSVPIVTISKSDGKLALPDLDQTLGYDLIGLANVYVLDEDASWALTDVLGRTWCCYHGAVRLYWPRFARNQDPFHHPLWTAERLCSRNVRDALKRFQRQLRGLIFRASALSVIRPREIDEIREAHNRRAFTHLRQQATSLGEYQELADSYARDNDQLRHDLAQAISQNENLQQQVRTLERNILGLKAHLTAKGAPQETEEEGDIAPGGDKAEPEPTSGETRYYKKIGARPTHDVMARAKDCGHNRWQGAHKADKAKKGIAKLESGRNDWQTVQHCASCTGGGMWRVRW